MTKVKMKQRWREVGWKRKLTTYLTYMCSFPVFAIWKKHGNKDKKKRESGRENQKFLPFQKANTSTDKLQVRLVICLVTKHTCTITLHDHHCFRFGVFCFFRKARKRSLCSNSPFQWVIPLNISAVLKDGACIKFPSCSDRIIFMGFNDQCWNLKWCQCQIQHCCLGFLHVMKYNYIALSHIILHSLRKKMVFSWMNNISLIQIKKQFLFSSKCNALPQYHMQLKCFCLEKNK